MRQHGGPEGGPDGPDLRDRLDDDRVRTLGARLAVVADRLRSRYLPVYAWAAGSAPVLHRAEELSQSWMQRFERDESGSPAPLASSARAPGAGARWPAGETAAPAGGTQPGQRAWAAAQGPVADGRPGSDPRGAGRAGRAVPVDVRGRLREVAGPGADAMRVLLDAGADAVARAHHADAVTVGADVHVRSGRYGPDTPDGFALLAHEASHVTALLFGHAAARSTPTGASAEEQAALHVEASAARALASGPAAGGGPADEGGPTIPPAAPRATGRLIASPALAGVGAPAGAAAPGGTTPAPTAPGAGTAMRADTDRRTPSASAPVDVDALRRHLIDDIMNRLRTDFERGG